MMYYGDHMSGWAWVFMGFGSVLLWVALIVGIVALVRHLSGGSPLGFGSRGSAEELLAQRFAHGEIDEAEYRQRMAVLADRAQAVNRS
jgi:putative membrane protein